MKRNSTLSLFRWLVAIVALANIAVSCAATEDITLQLKWRHQFHFAGYYAAQQQGFYRDEGLNVNIIEGSENRPPVQQVLSGRADYSIGDAEVLVSRISGKPLVALAAIFQHSPGVLLSLQKTNIQHPKDLVGKRIMMSSDGQGFFQFQAMLLKQQLDINQMIIVPHTWRLQDLIEGKVDVIAAYAMDEPEQLKQMGYSPAILTNQSYGVDFYGDVLFTSERELNNHPERVEAFLRATKKGWLYALSHQEEMAERISVMPGVVKRGLNQQALLREAGMMQPYVLTEVVPWGHMNEERWYAIAQTLADLGLVPPNIDLKGFIYQGDMRFNRPYIIWLARGIFILLLVLGGTFLWNLQIRRQVVSRTRALENEIHRRTETEYLLKVAGSVAKIGGWMLDIKTGILHWSDEVAALHEMPAGYSPTIEESVSLVVPDYRPLMQNALKKCIEEGISYDLELEKITANGRRFWVRAMGQSVRDATGNIVKLQGSLQDISAQKQLEAIKQGHNRIQAMMLADVSLDEILNTAAQLVELQFSGAICGILLLDKESLLHLHHAALSSLPLPYTQAMDDVILDANDMTTLTQGARDR